MKIKLIYPKQVSINSFEESGASYFEMRRGIWYPLLTFPVLAAYTPPGVEDIRIIDEEFEAIDFDDPVDLVGITVMTFLAHRAYEIAGRFRERGVKVVLGGMHVSALPEEAIQHADAIVIGEGEEVWPNLIQDFLKNELKPVYKAPHLFDTQKYRPARLDLLEKYSKADPSSQQKGYTSIAIFEVSRGCPYDCDFCAVTQFYGKNYRFRDIDRLIQDVRNFKLKFKTRLIGFVDDNLYGNKTYFKELLQKVSKLNVFWSGQISVNVAQNPDIVKMMADSGCRGMFVGFESLSQESLNSVNKKINRVDQYHRLMELFAKHNIMLFPSIMFGLDGDGPGIFEETMKFLNTYSSIIAYASFAILTPLPGTRLFQRMKAENRILHYDWRYYNFNNVLIKPALMSPEELQNGFEWIIRNFDYKKIFSRIIGMMGTTPGQISSIS
ncbi:MAG: radical SAM protein [Candidatus Aminicenantes bacterium]|nr:radical SAM protein [Candidatus Aminicenantes bacterium]